MAETRQTRSDKKSGKKLVWYRTSWGAVIVIFFAIAVFFVAWGNWAKPAWLKIEVSNCFVSLVAVLFTYLFFLTFRIRTKYVKLFAGLLWLLLLPNTAYLFTDVGHIPYQWSHTFSLSGRAPACAVCNAGVIRGNGIPLFISAV